MLVHNPEPFYVPPRGREKATGALRPGLTRADEDSVKRAKKNAVLGPLFKEGVLRVGKLELLGRLPELREHEGVIADEAAAKHGTPSTRRGVEVLTATEMAERAS